MIVLDARSYMVRWEGDAWREVWPGIYDPGVNGSGASAPYVSGDVGEGVKMYGIVGSTPTGYYDIGRWDGAAWTHLVPAGQETSLFTHDDGTGLALYAYGTVVISGHPVVQMRRYRNGVWLATTDPNPGSPRQFFSFDNGFGPALYTIGWFTPSSPNQQGLYRWSGAGFTLIGAPLTTGIAYILAATVHNDGSGPAIYIGGGFTNINGVPGTRSIARWDGHTWSALGPGGGEIEALASLPDSRGPTLMAFGLLTDMGGGRADRAAAWIGCPNCYANCDQSTIPPALNVNDFVRFLQRFAARVPEANCNVDATIDVSDFVCFLSKYAAGCP